MKCWICGEEYYCGSSLAPPEPCLCGMASSAWYPHGWRARLLRLGWKLVHGIWSVGEWVPKKMQKLTDRWDRYL